MSKLGIGERTRWGGFPKVIRNGDLGTLQDEPEYQAAKAGDKQAALGLVDRLLTDDTVQRIKEQIGERKPLVLPVLAVEARGNNKIPLAMAEMLADRLGLDVELGIVQREKVGRTGAGSDHRLAFNPSFQGDVKVGQDYLVVDDTLTMGGTIASLRGYVENHGGKVVAASVMTAHEDVVDLAVKPKMLAGIAEKHGPMMNEFWQETFGYGIDKLTQGEAGHLKAAPTVDAIRDRITAARHEGIERLDAARDSAPPRTTRSTAQAGVRAAQSGNVGEGLQKTAEGLEREQHALLEAAPLEQTYQESLAVYVQAKHDQAERIENRLEGIIDQQQTKLQQMQTRAPDRFWVPGTKRALQTQQHARLQMLHNRLETVREIKEGMGLHSPKIEELATRKMRADNPKLASDWDAMRETARRHQAMARNQEQERKQRQERSRRQTLNLSRPPE